MWRYAHLCEHEPEHSRRVTVRALLFLFNSPAEATTGSKEALHIARTLLPIEGSWIIINRLARSKNAVYAAADFIPSISNAT